MPVLKVAKRMLGILRTSLQNMQSSERGEWDQLAKFKEELTNEELGLNFTERLKNAPP